MDILIADAKGKWYHNTARFGFTDPESGTYFPAGAKVKAKATDWLAGQPVFQEVDDPTAEVVEAPSAPPAPAPASQPAKASK